MRSLIILAAIVSAAAPRALAAERMDDEREDAKEWIVMRDEWLVSPEGKAYVLRLCAMNGAELDAALRVALRDYLLIMPDSPLNTRDAEASGYRVLTCYREKISGYTWSNRAALSGFTWSNHAAKLAGFIWSNRWKEQHRA